MEGNKIYLLIAYKTINYLPQTISLFSYYAMIFENMKKKNEVNTEWFPVTFYTSVQAWTIVFKIDHMSSISIVRKSIHKATQCHERNRVRFDRN